MPGLLQPAPPIDKWDILPLSAHPGESRSLARLALRKGPQETPASAGDAVLLVSDAPSPLGVTPDAQRLGAHL